MAAYPGVYRAKCISVNGEEITAYIPQVYATTAVPFSSRTGDLPSPGDTGWVMFEGGKSHYPVWVSNQLGTVVATTTAPVPPPPTPDPVIETDWVPVTSTSDDIRGAYVSESDSAWYRYGNRVYLNLHINSVQETGNEVQILNPELFPYGGNYTYLSCVVGGPDYTAKRAFLLYDSYLGYWKLAIPGGEVMYSGQAWVWGSWRVAPLA